MADSMGFRQGVIHDVVVKPMTKFLDERGWLVELFRADEVAQSVMPVMSYLSMTQPGVARGPHEHVEQTDYFCFLGPSNFKVYLWDSRQGSPTFGIRQCFFAGFDSPKMTIIPPGVVHAYKNIGNENGLVFNAPNRLYAGEGKRAEVDEIRHEDEVCSRFFID